jgi:prepilin-type N-terminal cleavage/methylation domain-containing protein
VRVSSRRNAAPQSCAVRVGDSAGFTLLELIFVTGLISVISAIAVPTLLRGRAVANETATVGTIRALHTSQLTYALTCGAGLYAAELPALGGASGSEFISADMAVSANPMKSGYRYLLQPGVEGLSALTDCNGEPVALDYYVSAEPISVGQTGTRAFASNQAHVIWEDTSGVPPLEPFMPGPTTTPIQ